MTKKIVYITNVRMPTEKAHGIQMIKMCEAFALLGAKVLFVVPKRKNKIKEDVFKYYGVKEIFQIKRLPVIDVISVFPWIGYWLESLSFGFFAFLYLIFLKRGDKIIYTREYQIAFLSRILGFETVYEAHRILYPKIVFFSVVKIIKRIITNSEGTAEEFRERSFKNVLALPNGVDLREFDINLSKDKLRSSLGLPEDKKIVMYTGNFYNWKGTDTLIKAANILSKEKDLIFVFVGGENELEISKKKEECRSLGLGNTIFMGHKNRKEIPAILKSADILVLPNSPISEESIKYTSPVKLGEYMASGVPIIASDLPSIRHIVSDKAATFFKPDDASQLSEAIVRLLSDEVLAKNQSGEALREVVKYTWETRAKKILEFISK